MQQTWKTHIAPANSAIRINFKEVWEYRDLIALFVKRDFTAKYKQTILGPLWAVIQPLLTTVVFSIIFGSLAGLTTSDVAGHDLAMPSFLFYMIGTVTWSYFSSTVTANANTFITNRAIMGKVYYPRIATPIATALADLLLIQGLGNVQTQQSCRAAVVVVELIDGVDVVVVQLCIGNFVLTDGHCHGAALADTAVGDGLGNTVNGCEQDKCGQSNHSDGGVEFQFLSFLLLSQLLFSELFGFLSFPELLLGGCAHGKSFPLISYR